MIHIQFINSLSIYLIKSFISFLIPSYKIRKLFNISKHGKMDQIDYSIEVFLKHTDPRSLYGKNIMEIGNGDSFNSALISMYFGVNEIAFLDKRNFSNAIDFDLFEEINNKLDKLGFFKYKKINKNIAIKYYNNGLDSLSQIKSSQYDIIFSNSVLQHIELKQLNVFIQNMRRITKIKGNQSHIVDFKDMITASNFSLVLPDFIWDSKFQNLTYFYTNRLRLEEFKEIFTANNFNVNIVNISREYKYIFSKGNFASKYKNLEFDLTVSGAHFKLLNIPT